MNREKQIEEMAKAICSACNDGMATCNRKPCLLAIEEATAVFELGYRKLPEDSVVLSREEYEGLKSPRFIIETKKATNKEILEKLRSSTFAIVDNNAKIEIIPTRQEIEKETAKKILKEIRGYYPINKECCNKGESFILCLCDDIAKEYGVEVDDCGK